MAARQALAEAAVLVPKGVICLLSALQFHDLTLRMPSAVWMAIDRTCWRPTLAYPPIRFVRFSGPALTEGVERHPIETIEVPVYSPAKTIVIASATATRSAWTSPWRGCARDCAAGAARPTSSGDTPEPRGSGR